MVERAAKILIVDDDPAIRASLERVLTTAGHHVDQSGSGVDAIARLGSDDYALVVLDLRMPRLGGLTVLQHVRNRHPALPVVIMTGFPSIENAKESIQLGAFDFLLKPLDPTRILDVVSRALASAPWKLERR
jgi:DNA-binding NtrC family response regulator